jgi:N-acetylglucosaminyl-diphospho-decaprenol L-rhamnosyltransferase
MGSMPTPSVSSLTVIIVSYNSRSDLQRSLPVVASGDWEVIVIDNASTDGSAALIQANFPGVQVVTLPENLGYGGACNEGLKRTSAPFVLLLNPDAWPLDDGIEKLVECAERNRTFGVAGPELYSVDGRRQQSLVAFPTRWWLGRPAITSNPPQRPKVLGPIRRGRSFLVGAALLLRRDAVEQVGGFDGSFFMFYEEVDLCWRLLEAGWGVALCEEAKFVHIGGTSTQRNWPPLYREQLRGHLRFLAKHRGMQEAEFARKVLVRAVRLRALVTRGPNFEAFHAAARWLASAPASTLLAEDTGMPMVEAARRR